MGRRQRSRVPERISIWTILIGLLALGVSKENVELVSWAVVIGCGYELFIGKTQCRVSKVEGGACRNNARGRLRGCWIVAHRRAKWDAIFHRATGKVSPLARFRMPVEGSAEPVAASRSGSVPELRVSKADNSSNRLMLLLTIIGTAAGVISAIK
jgi:hypothetical protein